MALTVATHTEKLYVCQAHWGDEAAHVPEALVTLRQGMVTTQEEILRSSSF